jgi:hypothetical protein
VAFWLRRDFLRLISQDVKNEVLIFVFQKVILGL